MAQFSGELTLALPLRRLSSEMESIKPKEMYASSANMRKKKTDTFLYRLLVAYGLDLSNFMNDFQALRILMGIVLK